MEEDGEKEDSFLSNFFKKTTSLEIIQIKEEK